MGFALLVIFMFVAFGLTTLCRRWIDIPTLLGVAIGCAVNANLFTPITAPIMLGQFTFSIEIVLYTLFMYTIVVRILDYGYSDAKRMVLTSVAAILISAIIELFSLLATGTYTEQTFKNFSYYIFSSVGTIAAAWLMIFITIKCRKKGISSYLIIPFALVASSLVHALFYYGGIALMEWKMIMTLKLFAGTIIGKTVCILLSILCYFINQKYWQPLNLVSKEKIEDNKQNEVST